jgi:hypothetical protein
VPLGLFHRQAVGRDDRLALRGIGQEHERRVRALQRRPGLERAGQDLVEVDRPGELAEDPLPAALLVGPLERGRELLAELVHPRVQSGDHLGDPLIGRGFRPPAPDQQAEQEEREGSEGPPRYRSGSSSSVFRR